MQYFLFRNILKQYEIHKEYTKKDDLGKDSIFKLFKFKNFSNSSSKYIKKNIAT